jgi:hypothetical protein
MSRIWRSVPTRAAGSPLTVPWSDDGLSDSMLEEIRSATNGGWVLGTKRFREEVAALLGAERRPERRGRRPRKNDEIRL